MTGSDLKAERLARGWTQEQMGQAVGETKTVIGNWERGDHVPPRKVQKVRDALYPAAVEPDPLRGVSDTALIAELAKRLAERGAGIYPGQTKPASVTRTSAEGTAGPHSPPRMPRR